MAEQTMTTVPNEYFNKLIDLETTIESLIDNNENISADELKDVMKKNRALRSE